MASVLFALSSEHSVAQGIALSVRLLLQLGYDLSLSRNSSKALVLVAALCMNLIFIYYSADLTAKMTSQPPAVRIVIQICHNSFTILNSVTPWKFGN